jgi:hypothetical protein
LRVARVILIAAAIALPHLHCTSPAVGGASDPAPQDHPNGPGGSSGTPSGADASPGGSTSGGDRGGPGSSGSSSGPSSPSGRATIHFMMKGVH